MAWRDRLTVRGRLSVRFVVAAGLLVCTTVTAGVWTFFALTRLSGIVTDTVRQSESVTAVTSRLAGALEREDDAVLLILAGDRRGTEVLARERTVVDRAMSDLFEVLGPDDERELANPLRAALSAYRDASDAVGAVAFEREALVRYHQAANPLLRRAVALSTAIRDRHFALAREAVGRARDQAAAARRAVLLITLAALAIAVAVAWHLTRTVVGPLRRLTDGANAIRRGDFAERIDASSRDELGELAVTFNQMAEDLAEFRRTNIGEVVRAKNTLEATLEALPDAVVLLDGAGEIQSMNRAALRTLASAGVHGPRRLADLRIEGLDLHSVTRAISTGTEAVTATDLTQTIRVELDGTVQRLLPRVVPVSGLNPWQRGAILLLYEVTDLVRLDEMRSELVAVASHELQTPLTTLRMALLMLKETSDVLPDRHRELVDTSLIGVDQLAETVHEFLDLTRIEAGRLRLDLEPVQPSTVVAEALARVEGQAKAQSVTVTNHIDGVLPCLLADPLRLRAVFDNILSNALKYTPSGGSVTVDGRLMAFPDSRPAVVSISVIDTGPGIPPDFRSRVFDKFFRLEHHHADVRSGARGAGIGLYMCRQIVELHGGTIACEAGDGDSGTRITVTIPAVKRPAATPGETAAYARAR
jgi:NtrC-family two-component system sensor histidine kinase KinB